VKVKLIIMAIDASLKLRKHLDEE